MREQTLDISKSCVLITGAAGFIGSALAKSLLEGGCRRVVGVDDLSSGCDKRLLEHRLKSVEKAGGDWKFVNLDIRRKDELLALMQDCRAELLLHLAARAGVRRSISEPEEYISCNISGFFSVLEACREAASRGFPVEHLVYASSSSVYGSASGPSSEQSPSDRPSSLYAATKKSNELMAYSYAKLYGIPATGLRFFTVYGPAGRPDMACYDFALRMAEGRRIKLFNYGRCRRDFTYIGDLVKAVLLAAASPPAAEDAPHAVYNVGCGAPVEMGRFVALLRQALASAGVIPQSLSAEELIDLMPMQAGDVETTFADPQAFLSDFGYRPSTPLNRGLELFAGWFRDYLKEQREELL